jgi:hypothetical protein
MELEELDTRSTHATFKNPLASVAALALCTLAVAQEGAPAAAPACSFSADDRAWVERALEAWRLASREITGIGFVPDFQAILFDADCVLTSRDALSSPTAEGVTWSATPHGGTITAPNGKELPVGITSFTSGEKGVTFFVMSTPSVWSAGGAGSGAGLERTMVAVLLHEASHVAQIGPYGKLLGKLIDENSLPDSFNDNAVQERFGKDKEFAASIERETSLFLKAAAEKDDVEAKLLVFEARDMMRERQARWMVGKDAYLVEAEDLWLTFEGSGQWVGYQWQIHPKGGGRTPAEVLPLVTRRTDDWVQVEGFAIVLALDRIVGPDWKKHAFGDGAQTVLQMLDAALEEQ